MLDSSIAGFISVMMSSGTTASTGIYSSSSSLMIPSTAVSDIPSVTTSATDVDVDGSQTDDKSASYIVTR